MLVVSTDPAYPPQSFLNEETGEYEGFDIDVARAIAEGLGVEVEFTDPTFDAVVAGNWAGRWDVSVGSVTVTEERTEVLDFTQPYYFTPAQLSVQTDADFASVEDLAGETVCVGEATTYLFWIEGTLNLPEAAGEIAAVPEGMQATTLPTDIDCAEAWRSGRTDDFQGWLTALPTAQGAIDEDYPVQAGRRSGLLRAVGGRVRQGRGGRRLVGGRRRRDHRRDALGRQPDGPLGRVVRRGRPHEAAVRPR